MTLMVCFRVIFKFLFYMPSPSFIYFEYFHKFAAAMKAWICYIYPSNENINDYGFYATHEVISFIIFLHILQLFLSAIKSLKGRNCFELDRIYFLIFYFTIPSVIEKKSLFFMNTFFVGPSHIQHVFPRAFLHPTYTNFSSYSLPFCGFTIPQRQWKDCF